MDVVPYHKRNKSVSHFIIYTHTIGGCPCVCFIYSTIFLVPRRKGSVGSTATRLRASNACGGKWFFYTPNKSPGRPWGPTQPPIQCVIGGNPRHEVRHAVLDPGHGWVESPHTPSRRGRGGLPFLLLIFRTTWHPVAGKRVNDALYRIWKKGSSTRRRRSTTFAYMHYTQPLRRHS
jgi:hypothetical protein